MSGLGLMINTTILAHQAYVIAVFYMVLLCTSRYNANDAGLLMVVINVRHHQCSTTDAGNDNYTMTPPDTTMMTTEMLTTEEQSTTMNLTVCVRASRVN